MVFRRRRAPVLSRRRDGQWSLNLEPDERALLISLAVNNGFRNTLQRDLLGATAHINIVQKEAGEGIANWPELLRKVTQSPHVVAAAPELLQEHVETLGLRHENCRTHELANVEALALLCGREAQQVLREQDAYDVVTIGVHHREARVARADDGGEKVVVVGLDVEQVHPRRGDHHVAGDHVRHPQHAFQHEPRFGLDEVARLGVGQRADQLVARVGPGEDEVDETLEEAAAVAGGWRAAAGGPEGSRIGRF